MQDERNKRAYQYRPRQISDLRHHLDCTPEDLWSQIEEECGPTDEFDDDLVKVGLTGELLKHHLRRELIIRQQFFGEHSLLVPPEIAARVFTAVLKKCTPAPATDRDTLNDARRLLCVMLRRLRAARPRPAHRPRKNWWLRRRDLIACYELEARRRELQRSGSSRHDAIAQAAGRDRLLHGGGSYITRADHLLRAIFHSP
jgi:hypothetical protein